MTKIFKKLRKEFKARSITLQEASEMAKKSGKKLKFGKPINGVTININ